MTVYLYQVLYFFVVIAYNLRSLLYLLSTTQNLDFPLAQRLLSIVTIAQQRIRSGTESNQIRYKRSSVVISRIILAVSYSELWQRVSVLGIKERTEKKERDGLELGLDAKQTWMPKREDKERASCPTPGPDSEFRA